MSFFEGISFSLPEALALAGVVQGVSILTYLGLRVQDWRQVLPGFLCFLVLTACCLMQFFLRFEDLWPTLRVGFLFLWAMVPALSYLLILQIGAGRGGGEAARSSSWNALILFAVPLVFGAGSLLPMDSSACRGWFPACAEYVQILYWLVSLASALVLGCLWLQRGLFEGLRQGSGGRERYWLVLTFILTNAGISLVMLLAVSDRLSGFEVESLLLVLGLSGLYLASSSLFRVYPAVIDLAAAPRILASPPVRLSAVEEELLSRAKDLIEVQKAYHEQSFNRTSFARELGCSENQLYRIIKHGYGKSLPRLLSEYRIADACRLLEDRKITVNIIAYEVGFSSLASFNRVFKDVVGLSPSAYRQRLWEQSGRGNSSF